MRDLLGTGSTWLTGKRTTNASKVVSYARDSDSVDLSATKTGRQDQQVDAATGVLTAIVGADWIVSAADLVIASVAVEPQIGDLITETIDGHDFIYEVLAGGGDKCWRWNDRNNTTYRVHTKLIEG